MPTTIGAHSLRAFMLKQNAEQAEREKNAVFA